MSALNHCLASADEAWAIGGSSSRFPHLTHFCGGLASLFPNTASVVSDCSVLGCEKTDKRTLLSDLSLDGIMRCKQQKRLGQLATDSW
ncbi:hypothetical protein GN958_ATG16926 [Phytophthora infestans]|uniref:Uncharacterized protein n=1 Tax=Phytophthora infestans TaxID=4787 RepID=A0A8S9U357_PHYIN|nr:hypothetical protein GN958_ATG16926 [Phytophthora infestans]